MGRIQFDSQGVKEAATRFQNNADAYDTELKNIKEAIEGLKPSWTDAAGIEFFNKFEEKYAIIDGMGQAIRDLGIAVEGTARKLDDTISQSMSEFN